MPRETAPARTHLPSAPPPSLPTVPHPLIDYLSFGIEIVVDMVPLFSLFFVDRVTPSTRHPAWLCWRRWTRGGPRRTSRASSGIQRRSGSCSSGPWTRRRRSLFCTSEEGCGSSREGYKMVQSSAICSQFFLYSPSRVSWRLPLSRSMFLRLVEFVVRFFLFFFSIFLEHLIRHLFCLRVLEPPIPYLVVILYHLSRIHQLPSCVCSLPPLVKRWQ